MATPNLPPRATSWTPSEEREYRRVQGILTNLKAQRQHSTDLLFSMVRLAPNGATTDWLIEHASEVRRLLKPFDASEAP